MTEEEREAQAGEYVLGTMPPEERTEFDRALALDPTLQALVRDWEERLAGLADLVPEATPNPETWAKIEAALERKTRRDLLTASNANVPEDNVPDYNAPDYTGASAATASVAPLRRSRARWRAAALMTGAIAAGLALFVATGLRRGAAGDYLAVVDRGGDQPALLVHVDTAAGVVHVVSVKAETPSERSLELWYIAPSGGAPRSMGLVDRTRLDAAIPAVARSGGLAGATLAVSVEPPGGSPTGSPTGPVVYSGKLVPE